jgi:hypothetical protein
LINQSCAALFLTLSFVYQSLKLAVRDFYLAASRENPRQWQLDP